MVRYGPWVQPADEHRDAEGSWQTLWWFGSGGTVQTEPQPDPGAYYAYHDANPSGGDVVNHLGIGLERMELYRTNYNLDPNHAMDNSGIIRSSGSGPTMETKLTLTVAHWLPSERTPVTWPDIPPDVLYVDFAYDGEWYGDFDTQVSWCGRAASARPTRASISMALRLGAGAAPTYEQAKALPVVGTGSIPASSTGYPFEGQGMEPVTADLTVPAGEFTLGTTTGLRGTSPGLETHHTSGIFPVVAAGSWLNIQYLRRWCRPSRWRYVYPDAGGMWRLRQRQSAGAADGWALRHRQNSNMSGSWPLRQRQDET